MFGRGYGGAAVPLLTNQIDYFGRPFRGPVNLISSFGIPRQRHPQPDSQTPRAFYLVPTFGGLPMGEVWC